MTYHHGIRFAVDNSDILSNASMSTTSIGIIAKFDRTPGDGVGPFLLKKESDVENFSGEGRRYLEQIYYHCSVPVIAVNASNGDISDRVNALKKSESTLGIKPKIVITPGSQDYAEKLPKLCKSLKAIFYADFWKQNTKLDGANNREYTHKSVRGMGLYPACLVEKTEDDEPPVTPERPPKPSGKDNKKSKLPETPEQPEQPKIPESPGFMEDTGLATIPLSVIQAALRAKTDSESEFGFSNAESNQVIRGISGLKDYVDYSSSDEACGANILNHEKISTVIRYGGEFRLWGVQSLYTSDEEAYKYLTTIRIQDYLEEYIEKTFFYLIDKKLTSNLVEEIKIRCNEHINSKLIPNDVVYGGECFPVNNSKNIQNLISNGLQMRVEISPVMPNETMTFTTSITTKYMEKAFEGVFN